MTEQTHQVTALQAWQDQVADIANEMKSWAMPSRKASTTMLTLGKLQADLHELRTEIIQNAPIEAITRAERAAVLKSMAEFAADYVKKQAGEH